MGEVFSVRRWYSWIRPREEGVIVKGSVSRLTGNLLFGFVEVISDTRGP